MKQRILHRLFCMLLAVALVFSFSACRQSPVLQQVQYVEHAEADPNQQQRDNDESHTLPDQEIAARTEQTTASRRENQNDSKAKKGDENNAPNQSAAKENFDQAGQNRNEAAQANQTNPNNENNSQGQSSTPGTTEDPNANAPVADETGEKYTLPENIEKVAAVGDAALYVEMLGGRGRLAATSADVTSRPLFNLFGESVPTPWNNALTPPEGGLASVPQGIGAVFMVNNAMFSSEDNNAMAPDPTAEDQSTLYLQNSAVNAEKMAVIPLMPFNTTDNIKTNVRVMAKVLGTVNGVDAPARAEDYCRWLDDTVSKGTTTPFTGAYYRNFNSEAYTAQGSSDNTNGQYTILIDAWFSGISFQADGVPYQGIPVVKVSNTKTSAGHYAESPVNYYLSQAGVVNQAALVGDVSKTRQRALCPVYLNFAITNGTGWSLQNFEETSYQDVNRDTFFNEAHVGDPNFTKIIVNADSTRDNILNSGLWVSSRLNSYITGAESVDYVTNPSGIGDWKSGSPESPLETVFAAIQFNGGVPDTLRADVEYFYTTFYGVSFNDDIWNNILNGDD